MNPSQAVCATHDNEMYCFVSLANANEGTTYTDQTGRFPVMPYAGTQYIFIAYMHDENAILMHPLHSRDDAAMVLCFNNVYNYLEERLLGILLKY